MPNDNPQSTSIFIQLEHEARHAQSIEALFFTIANSTKKLFPFHQAIVWRLNAAQNATIEAVSGTGQINQQAPFIIWCKEVSNTLNRQSDNLKVHSVEIEQLPQDIKKDWREWAPEHTVWCPLINAHDKLLGGFWLTRETPWEPHEVVILQELCDAYGHAWGSLLSEKRSSFSNTLKQYSSRKVIKWGAIAAAIILLLPLRQTVLAPAEIVAKAPAVISSPLEGVVEEIPVEPNQPVKKGQTLYVLDKTQFLNQYRVAEKALHVAEQRYRKAGQHAFQSDESKSELAVLGAEVAKQRAQMEYAKSLLDKITVTAPVDGTVIFSSKQEWIGKPVVTGEKVMLVANPEEKEMDAWLPVSDAIKLNTGSKVKLFLNVSPLNPIDAKIKYVNYSATTRPDGTLAYLVKAQFTEADVPRIGLKGTAKLYGNRAILFYNLFWRPISAVRRTIGI